MKTKSLLTILLLTSIAFGAICTQITILVVPPMVAAPKGGMLVIHKREMTNFIDSPDSICIRQMGNTSLLCRALIIGSIMMGEKEIMRLPYVDSLYLISTGGERYGN